MITSLAQHGCDLNAFLESGRTPLLVALQCHDVDLVKALLHAGADPNQPDADKEQYPLNYAVVTMKSAEDTEMVDLLLNHGRCKINQGSGPFTTAFSYVLAKVDEWPIPCAVDLAMRMLDTVEDVNDDRCAVGTTLLHVAVLRGRQDVVDMLLKREAQLETVDSFGITPILLACQCTTKMIFPLYERGANIFATMHGGAGALAIAAGADHEDTDALKMLIEIGLDPNARSEMGHTPLLAALYNSREESALYLINQGVNVDLTTKNKQITALHFAARGGLARVVEKLLQNPNIDIDAKSADEWTPLQKVRHSKSTCKVVNLGCQLTFF
jgi:ankyrin repeat protein